MYQIGDLIVYGFNGVCRVEKIETLEIPGVGKRLMYYKLCPLYSTGKIYAPLDTSVFMRPVMSYDDARKLISSFPAYKEKVINNIKSQEEYYEELFQTNDCYDLLRIIKTIYLKNGIGDGKQQKLNQMDERYLIKAENILYGELAVALGIPRDKVREYILEKIQ